MRPVAVGGALAVGGEGAATLGVPLANARSPSGASASERTANATATGRIRERYGSPG
jgi:hypothetical protein